MLFNPLQATDTTVIVPLHNTDVQYLKPCLNSINNQTVPINVIIIDDASDKSYRDWILDYIEDKPNWKYVRHYFNQGVAIARNTGLKLVKTPYVAFCDSDDTWYPNKLELQLKNLYYGYAADICGVTIDYRNDAGYPMTFRNAPVDLIKTLGDDANLIKFDRIYLQTDSNQTKQLLQDLNLQSASEFIETDLLRVAYTKLIRFNASLCGSNAVFNTHILRKSGGFNPKFNGADEWDALLNVANDYHISVTPENLCNYVRHVGSFSTTKIEHLRSVCEDIIYKHRKNLNDGERVLLQSVETATWAVEFEKLTFAPNTPYKIIQYHG